MAKRARPFDPTPADLVAAVHVIPWDAPHVIVDEAGRWWAQFEPLRQRTAFARACAEAAREASARVTAVDWTAEPAADIVACAEAMGYASHAARGFLAYLLDLDDRDRRRLYAAGWMVHCWERGVRPGGLPGEPGHFGEPRISSAPGGEGDGGLGDA